MFTSATKLVLWWQYVQKPYNHKMFGLKDLLVNSQQTYLFNLLLCVVVFVYKWNMLHNLHLHLTEAHHNQQNQNINTIMSQSDFVGHQVSTLWQSVGESSYCRTIKINLLQEGSFGCSQQTYSFICIDV